MSDIAAWCVKRSRTSKLPPRRLELEITESLLIERPDEVVEKLTELKALGVTIAMDDFGTGYSSLSYLLKFPFDKIKIDKSFVSASSEDMVARDILRSIASLGKTLKITSPRRASKRRSRSISCASIACSQLQGYYFAKPLDESRSRPLFPRPVRSGHRPAHVLAGRPRRPSANSAWLARQTRPTADRNFRCLAPVVQRAIILP